MAELLVREKDRRQRRGIGHRLPEPHFLAHRAAVARVAGSEKNDPPPPLPLKKPPGARQRPSGEMAATPPKAAHRGQSLDSRFANYYDAVADNRNIASKKRVRNPPMLQSRWACLALGIVIGAVVAANVAGWWPQTPVHALATHGQDNFAIATGPIATDVEAVYILDYLTGELKAAVLNLNTGKFLSFFEHNISKDLATGVGKNPRYLMVTGMADLRKGGANLMGTSVVYVAEFTSGQIAAYGIHWQPSQSQKVEPFKDELFYLDGFKFRAAAIRN
jgi:hypothetical protein